MINVRSTIALISILLFIVFYYDNDWLAAIENQANHSKIHNIGPNLFVIKNAKRLPSKSMNFQTYSRFLSAIGRTHVHEKVRDVILHSYKILEKTQQNVTFTYGETGWANGGNFWPHRTHRNGLCVDFMVPVLEITPPNNPSVMFLWLFNGWGYNIRFDSLGRNSSYSINFKAIIEHLYSLQIACQLYSLRIKQVIFDLDLLKLLKESDKHNKLKAIPFANFKAWFPHDSHYHVEFEIIDHGH